MCLWLSLPRSSASGTPADSAFPRPLLDEASLTNEVELRAEPGKLTVRAVRTPRAGWADVAREARAAGDDRLLDPPFRNDFDENDWRW